MTSLHPDKSPTDLGVPNHIAIIMDGNGRWAKSKYLPRFVGHKAGVETVRTVVRSCIENNIPYLTLFAFSSENWRRPEKEVGLLMDLFKTSLSREAKKLHENGVKLNIIGDRSQLDEKIILEVNKAEELTKNNNKLTLTVAVNYGGRWDIVEATKKVCEKIITGGQETKDISAELFEENLALAHIPPPDLFIRTGGEKRISNFLLWHLAYSEFYFTDVLWPAFDNDSFLAALKSYKSRQRRYGKTSEQLAGS